MNETLKNFYDRFYTPLTVSGASQEIEDVHRQLIQRLNKPERKLILRIIDAKDHIAEERSIDSFICGFELAWKLSSESTGIYYQIGGSQYLQLSGEVHTDV